MALTTFYTPRFQSLDDNGAILSNGYLEFFEAGTSTPLAVYADVDGITSLGVVVTADISGLFPEMFMLPQAYDINLYDENDVLIWSAVDWFPPQAASSANQDSTGTAGVTFAAGEGGYMSDGSAGLNAGQWYKWDADLSYASETPETGFAVAAIAAGDQGLFRTAGKVTGLSGLTPGARYFISGTAGAIATTAGTFTRMVGQAESTTVLMVQTNPPLPLEVIDARVKDIVDGRLTLTTGEPVTTADVTAAATLFWALYKGNQIALYSGTRWVVMTFAQLSVAAPAVANQVYDAFVDYNDGTPILALTAWTNDTTRATALVKQDGVYVKSGDTQQRYVGTVRTVTASQFNDAFARRHVWNYYNRVPRVMRVLEATASWAYSTAAFQQARASTANQLDLVIGVAEDMVHAEVLAIAANDTSASRPSVAIGFDSTAAAATGTLMSASTTATTTLAQATASLDHFPTIGRHIYTWLEWDQSGAGITTWRGVLATPPVQSGISGSVMG